MTIHVVTAGQTLTAIAKAYGIAPGILARYNALRPPYALAVGQSLLILQPTKLHTVSEGETLAGIAREYGVPVMQLWQNNPNLEGSAALFPGQVLVIALADAPTREIFVNGYAYPFVKDPVLRGILPYASSLTPFTYGIGAGGTLVPLDDDRLIERAKQYDALPLMHLSTLTDDGSFSSDLAGTLLSSQEAMAQLADNVVQTMLALGYQGLDLDFEFLGRERAAAYAAFAGMLHQRVNALGYPLITALAPKTYATQPGVLYEGHDYAALGANSDAVLIMTYEWGYTYGPAMAVAPLQSVRRVLEYAVTEIAPHKILMGFPNYAYNWTLPYVSGESRAQLISNEDAVALAVRVGAEIRYDETAATPYFVYRDEGGATHEVWFEDARSTTEKLRLIEEYGLAGVGYWNFMRPFVTGFSVQNALYRALKASTNARGRLRRT
ncbi:MAG: LysM peptidoglycan-binding domain-containing protein [Oscillospiraceae bacterium]|nr:LysM peptidoglycan-binding domain-containing protein [Oscillospiraceae bacterium]